MNKSRRETIAEIRNRVSNLFDAVQEAHGKDDNIADDIETVAAEERDYYDNMPEGLQNSDKGNSASEAADALDSAKDTMQEVSDSLAEFLDKLNEVMESLDNATNC